MSEVLPAPPTTAFPVPELILLQAWAEFHGIQLRIELDNVFGDIPIEEQVVLFAPASRFRRWTLWRTEAAVLLQPANRPTTSFGRLQDALEAMIPERD